jgi:hypothetical protein
LSDLCIKHNVDCSAPRTSARLLDKVWLFYLIENWKEMHDRIGFGY